jgi:hypothetical protein
MTPHSLVITKGVVPKVEINPEWVKRHGVYPKGTVLPETAVLSCPRRKMSDFPKGFIAPRLYEKALDHNQQVASCCRQSENHEIEGWKSHPDEKRTDRYTLICQCGRKHHVLCVGLGDERPEWK